MAIAQNCYAVAARILPLKNQLLNSKVEQAKRATNRCHGAGAYPLGASCITANVWPSGSLKNAIQRS
jgi:hypothetical protein